MSAADELAAVVYKARWVDGIKDVNLMTDSALADAILAAGYRKPRTITTAEELDALAEGTQIVDQCERLTLEETSIQFLEWVDRHGNACHVELPATILEEKS